MRYKKLRLGVNVDHVATLREARGTLYPVPLEAALLCEQAGASGITIHLREDRRHIQDSDLYEMKRRLTKRLNLEMADTPKIVQLALKTRPDEVCFVPEKRMELTTEGGLDVVGNKKKLARTVSKLTKAGIEVSMFVDPDRKQLEACVEIGAPCVELHTGTFCDQTGWKAKRELRRLVEGARYAQKLGLQVNAGHGINLDNVQDVLKMPFLDTLNIGHSIIARSVFVGIGKAVREMLARMADYQGNPAR